MEFESPDVERDFPGLYASESGKKSNESDFSDDNHEKTSKKDLLIGKRKDKKDSKKDRGYATLEGESSPEEDSEVKSPSKTKKAKPFKFPSKKEKREKSREKDLKEKEGDKEKKKVDDKEKKKEPKVKLKLKERKKSKNDESSDSYDLPIFGVNLSLAVERSKCHDGIDIPLVVRDCIDHVQQTGLPAENLYKVSGIKSRVQQVRRLYNDREAVNMADYDLPVATSLLKQFLRELPDPLLTCDLLPKFEEASSMKEGSARAGYFKNLIDKLPSNNKTLLGWLLVHFDEVIANEKLNKMNAQSVAATMGPILGTSERLLSALLSHSSTIFPNLKLTKYVPPLTSNSPALPETCEGISQELKKQESLLSQIHAEVSSGRVSKSREEQLWEVQRIITQLKRKLRILERGQRSIEDCESSLRSDEDPCPNPPKPASPVDIQRTNPRPLQEPTPSETGSSAPSVESIPVLPSPFPLSTPEIPFTLPPSQIEPVPILPPPPSNHIKHTESLEVEDINRASLEVVESKKKAIYETEELENVIRKLRLMCEQEKTVIRQLRAKINDLGGVPPERNFFEMSSDEETGPPREKDLSRETRQILKHETTKLERRKDVLMENIMAEYDACIDLRVQIKLLKVNKNH